MKIILPYFILLVNLFVKTGVVAQPANDNCQKPEKLSDVSKYCSAVGAFTTVGATPSGYGIPSCWNSSNGDVWFSFRAFASDVSITVIGTNIVNNSPGGTLASPQVALYSGVCGGVISELNCGSDATRQGVITIYEGGLIIGQDYLLRIDGLNGASGTFQLCINNYFPPAQAEQDCNRATVICDNSPFVNKSFQGAGLIRDEGKGSCLGEGGGAQASEMQSTWYTWKSTSRCTLTFSIAPLNPGDDIDFALYELPSGLHNCNDKKLLRCNATAPPCSPTGRAPYVTGLSLTERDTTENFNCDAGENAFSKYLVLEKDKYYSLLINNFSATGIGFAMEWGGCDFAGPEPAFTTNPSSGLRCETDFIIQDSSVFEGGRITRYDWNFGKDAIPQTGTGPGPHKVNYFSFGEKFITLTVETDLGCKVTEVRRVFAEPCCEDLPDLLLSVDSVLNTKCHQSNDGAIVVRGELGNPYIDQSTNQSFYLFSLDKENFFPLNKFSNLSPGVYKIYIQDRKGCLDSTNVTITEPPPIIADAGADKTIDLGDEIFVNGSALPNQNYEYEWSGNHDIECKTCQSSKVLPLQEGYLVLKVVDQNGCEGYDSLYIRIIKNYDVFAPNVFSANGDGINDVFTVFGSKAVRSIEYLRIYDRWGEEVYHGANLPLDDPTTGWNGEFRGSKMNPGVFAYVVKVKFIDGFTKEISGEFTLLR
ncbi:MAG: gliding motility-associated C-terminal domain-containing protein [Saprospiraceae bacterium]|nr:gliding motility-associated C-terminal domain-containing protein [Saprospiraceae bacterium]